MIIQTSWNKVTERKNTSLKLRDYLSFSDIGKPYADVYLKMMATPVTNDFEDRVLRIFDAGKLWEFVVLRALAMAGILNQKQTLVSIPATEDTLEIHGYLDCTIGGFANWTEAKEKINRHLEEYKLTLDDQLIEQKAMQLIDDLALQFPDRNVPEMLVEVKSINSMAFWAHKNRDEQNNFLGYMHNKLQLYGYMKATGIKRGILLYISKDDCVMEEIGMILGDETMEAEWNKYVKEMTKIYKSGIQPPKEEDIVWNDRKKCYEVNWKIERSPYLTFLTGMTKEDWLDKWEHEANRLNLEAKWKVRALDLKIDITGMSAEEIKKTVMKMDREAKKALKEAQNV